MSTIRNTVQIDDAFYALPAIEVRAGNQADVRRAALELGRAARDTVLAVGGLKPGHALPIPYIEESIVYTEADALEQAGDAAVVDPERLLTDGEIETLGDALIADAAGEPISEAATAVLDKINAAVAPTSVLDAELDALINGENPEPADLTPFADREPSGDVDDSDEEAGA